MNPTGNLNNNERDIERLLAALSPAAGPRREDVLFEAGVRAGRRRMHAWQGVSAVLTVALVTALAVSAALRGPAPAGQGAVVQNVPVSAPMKAPPAASPADPVSSFIGATLESNPSSYLNARNAVLKDGLDALTHLQPPPPSVKPAKPAFPTRKVVGGDES